MSRMLCLFFHFHCTNIRQLLINCNGKFLQAALRAERKLIKSLHDVSSEIPLSLGKSQAIGNETDGYSCLLRMAAEITT